MNTNIGVIADTHGPLRPEAIEFLKRCNLIMHAGDVGNPDILIKLRSIARTYAIAWSRRREDSGFTGRPYWLGIYSGSCSVADVMWV